MHIEKVFKSKQKNKIKDLYMSSFPKEEQMPFNLMLIMSCQWNTEFLAFYDKNTLIGFVYLASLGKQTFIMFLAVDKKLRQKGYGSCMLEKLQSLYPNNKIIVSIEPCDKKFYNLKQRLKRKQFYIKNGYKETGYFMKLSGQEQEILIKNGEFDRRGFIIFFMIYSFCTTIPKIWRV